MNKPVEKMPVQAAPNQVQAITPMDMLQRAVEQNADLDKLQQLMDLQERWEATQARKAFVGAMQQFMADPPVVIKNKQVKFGNTEYKHATHDQVVTTIGAALAKVGITHRWEITQQDGGITVTCVLTHIDGHMDRTTMSAAPDNSGSKNSIQAISSTTTYLQRYTLLAATGVASQDDDDGRGAESVEPINDKQASTIIDLIAASETDTAKFLKWIGAESVETIPQSKYKQALTQLERKVKAAGEPV